MHPAPFATPDAEIAALRALLAERDAVLAERDAALAEREAALQNAGFEIEKLKVQLAALRRDRFGKSSEKLAAEIGQLEMLIGIHPVSTAGPPIRGGLVWVERSPLPTRPR